MTATQRLGQGSSTVQLLGMPEAQGWHSLHFPVSVCVGTREGLRFDQLGTAPLKAVHH